MLYNTGTHTYVVILVFFGCLSYPSLMISMEERENPTIGTRSKAEQEKLNQDLATAAYEGNIAQLKKLLASGADINWRGSEGMTALHWAADNNQVLAALLLLNAKADINAQKDGGFTALHIAAQRGHLPMTETLMRRGANSSKVSDDGCTPLAIARKQNHTLVTKHLKDHASSGSLAKKIKRLFFKDTGSSTIAHNTRS